MLVQVAYGGPRDAVDPVEDARDYVFQVQSWPDADLIRFVRVRVHYLTRMEFVRGDLNPAKKVEAERRLTRGIVLAALGRLEGLGAALLEDLDTRLLWTVTKDEIHTILNGRKVCSYQERRGRDLFCIAAKNSPPKDFPTNRKTCTTLHACETVCNLPDTRVLCSNFAHVDIVMASAFPPHPIVGPRVCEVGHQDRIQVDDPKCLPDGHDCWRRIVDLSTKTSEERLSPLALNDSLDHLSWVWRAKFPASQTKLIHLASSATAAEITQPCSSPETFRSRMNALADLLDAMKIDGNLMATPAITGTLNRLQDALRKALPALDFARADAAIRELQAVVDVRTALHHSDAGKKLPPAALKLGIDWPPSDWARTWERVRDRAANAVRELRQAIEPTV